MRKYKAASGFTLVELIIVVGIISIVTTIGMANYFGERSARRLQVATEVLVREMQLTMERSRSQENSQQWWVHLDNPVGSGNDFYTVCYGVYTASGASCAVEGVDGTESKKTSLGTGLEFTDPASIPKDTASVSKDVVFNKATGLPTPSTAVTIRIDSTAGAGFKIITVNPNGSIAF